MNIGLLTGAGRAFYLYPEYRHSPSVVSSTVAAAVFLAAAEGFAADHYHKTPEGKAAERRARKEGSAIYRQLHDIVLRPSYFGGLLGVGSC